MGILRRIIFGITATYLLRNRKYEELRSIAAKGSQDHPMETIYRDYLGKSLEALQRRVEAIHEYEQLLKQDQSFEYYLKLISLNFQEKNYDQVLKLINQLQSDTQTQQRPFTKSLIKGFADNLNYYQGVSLYRLEKFEESIKYLSKIKTPFFTTKFQVQDFLKSAKEQVEFDQKSEDRGF